MDASGPKTAFDLSAVLDKKTTLKHATIEHDSSAPRVQSRTTDLTEANIKQYHNSVLNANIEEWEKYLSAAHVTFESRYINLTIEDCRALLDVTEANLGHRTANPDNLAMVSRLADDIQQIIDNESGWSPGGVFVKTSSRSAKDAALARARFLDIYVKHCRESSQPPYSVNDRIISLIYAGTMMMKCSTGADAMAMMTSSERIARDMMLALNAHEHNGGEFRENIVVREWHDIDVSQEWRCFVCHRHVTAVSQYNYLAMFNDLVINKDHYRDVIVKFLNDVVLGALPADKFDSFVVDVALTGDVLNNPRCWVIELNPFLSSTDGALFSWSNELDILQGHVDGGPVFRVQHSASDGARCGLAMEWRNVLDHVVIDDENK